MHHVFDACALIAYLRGEPGGAVVDGLLKNAADTCYVHTVNLVEVYYDFIRNHSEPVALQALEDLAAAGILERRDMDRNFILRVGQLKARGRISLADCFVSFLPRRFSVKW